MSMAVQDLGTATRTYQFVSGDDATVLLCRPSGVNQITVEFEQAGALGVGTSCVVVHKGVVGATVTLQFDGALVYDQGGIVGDGGTLQTNHNGSIEVTKISATKWLVNRRVENSLSPWGN